MDKEYTFSSSELESKIPELKKLGVTELSVHDEGIKRDKKKLLSLIQLVEECYPSLFVSFLADVSVIDREFLEAAEKIFCSFDIPLEVFEKGGKLLFDKKLYSKKAFLLNERGTVFGFHLTYALKKGDTLKNFMERLDFAVQQYPNHIDFPQIQNSEVNAPVVTGLFSAKDIRYARDVAFSCRTFYSAGRAVPWMASILKALKIYPSKLFADFAEWQRVNNCDFKSGFLPESEPHTSIEKMQLLFLEQKFEEKNALSLFPVAKDIIRLNGAVSRLMGEGEESVVRVSYLPDDLLGPESLDLNYFLENVCMEECSVRLKIEDGEPVIKTE